MKTWSMCVQQGVMTHLKLKIDFQTVLKCQVMNNLWSKLWFNQSTTWNSITLDGLFLSNQQIIAAMYVEISTGFPLVRYVSTWQLKFCGEIKSKIL